MSEVRKVALKAAELLREDGWIQGSFCTDEGRCLRGALDVAAEGLGLSVSKTWNKVYDRVGMPARWNDDPARTKEEVLNLLEQIAEDA